MLQMVYRQQFLQKLINSPVMCTVLDTNERFKIAFCDGFSTIHIFVMTLI